MIETKLHQAAQALPKPTSTFSQIQEKAYRSQRRSAFGVRQYRRVAALLVCVVLLMGSAAIAATTEVDYSAWASRSREFADCARIADKLGITLPESMGDSPFYEITTLYVVPEGTTYLQALSTPTYQWYDVNYGIQEITRTEHSESIEVSDEYSLALGTTDGELWGYVFSLDESGIWALENTLPGSYQTEEYKGITLQMGTTVNYSVESDSEIFSYHHKVIWLDANNHVVFVLNMSTYAEEDAAYKFPDTMIEFAKSIIDQNTPVK